MTAHLVGPAARPTGRDEDVAPAEEDREDAGGADHVKAEKANARVAALRASGGLRTAESDGMRLLARFGIYHEGAAAAIDRALAEARQRSR